MIWCFFDLTLLNFLSCWLFLRKIVSLDDFGFGDFAFRNTIKVIAFHAFYSQMHPFLNHLFFNIQTQSEHSYFVPLFLIPKSSFLQKVNFGLEVLLIDIGKAFSIIGFIQSSKEAVFQTLHSRVSSLLCPNCNSTELIAFSQNLAFFILQIVSRIFLFLFCFAILFFAIRVFKCFFDFVELRVFDLIFAMAVIVE